MTGPSAPGHPGPDAGRDRCGMCGAVVPVGVDGRCPLGHRVRAADDAHVVATYDEPSADPRAGWSQAPATPPTPATPAGSAPPPTPSRPPGPALPPSPEPLPLRITDRLRTPIGDAAPPVPLDIPSEDLADDVVRAHADNAAAFASMVAAHPTDPHPTDPHPTAPHPTAPHPADPPAVPTGAHADDGVAASALGPAPARSGPSHADLTPTAPSALDLDTATLAPPTPAVEPTYEQLPLDDDPDVIPPRTWLQRGVAVLFVLALLAAAWFLATSL